MTSDVPFPRFVLYKDWDRGHSVLSPRRAIVNSTGNTDRIPIRTQLLLTESKHRFSPWLPLSLLNKPRMGRGPWSDSKVAIVHIRCVIGVPTKVGVLSRPPSLLPPLNESSRGTNPSPDPENGPRETGVSAHGVSSVSRSFGTSRAGGGT